MKYINSAILANLPQKPLKLGRLIVLMQHIYSYNNFRSHGNPLFSSPLKPEINILEILRLENIKQGYELNLMDLFQLHHTVHNMGKKPLGLFWQLRPSTSNYNDTLYYYLLQDLSIRHKTRDRAERQFTQLLLSERRPEKTCRKKLRGEKSRQENGSNFK